MVTADQDRTAHNLVEELFAAAFDIARDTRSPEYKAGVRAALEYRVNGVRIHCPHPSGSAQFDAFYAGIGEGHNIWRAYTEAGHDKTVGAPSDGA